MNFCDFFIDEELLKWLFKIIGTKTEKDKYRMVSFICGIQKKSRTHTNREWTSGCRGWREGGNRERLVKGWQVSATRWA